MKVHVKSETEIELTKLHQDGFDIVADDPALHFGSMQMFASSIAMCTFSVLASYGRRFDAESDDITIGLTWAYAERPYRMEVLAMDISWPQLPESRLDAATRAARHCTLHNTLQHGLEVETMVQN